MSDMNAMSSEAGASGSGRPVFVLLWLLACSAVLTLVAANLFLGELNQDEGWYLYGAKQVSMGRQPYVDFASTQGPVMPYVYSVAMPLVEKWGVAGGRLFTAILGLLSVFSAAWLASRLVQPGRRNLTALLAFCLVGVNVYQSYFCTIVKTYALTSLLLMLGFVALTFIGNRRGAFAAFIAGLLLSAAAATRLSAIVALPVVFVCLLFVRNKADDGSTEPVRGRFVPAVLFAAGSAAALAALFVPFLLKAPEALRFALFDYHAARSAGNLAGMLAYKAGFVSRIVQDYFVAIAALLVIVVFGLLSRRGRIVPRRPAIVWMLWLSVLAITAVHFLTPFPYDDYQVMVYPLFAAGLSVELARLFSLSLRAQSPDRETGLQGGVALMALIICAAAAFSSPVNQSWFIGSRDRMWWPVRPSPALAVLQKNAQFIKSMTKPGDLLLTQDAYLAVESGLMLPHGLELGPFSYFPDWSREKAEKRHVMNREMMLELLETSDAPVAAFSGYGLTIRSPEITELPVDEQRALKDIVDRRYELIREVGAFGQADTTLQIYRKRGNNE